MASQQLRDYGQGETFVATNKDERGPLSVMTKLKTLRHQKSEDQTGDPQEWMDTTHDFIEPMTSPQLKSYGKGETVVVTNRVEVNLAVSTLQLNYVNVK